MKIKLTFIILLFLTLTSVKILNAFTYPNTYPYGDQGNNSDGLDDWGWYKWNCTSYAGWKVRENFISNFTNYYTRNGASVTMGNATTWDTRAATLGFTVTDIPTYHSVAKWDANTPYAPSEYGHVAWVEKVNTNNTIDVSEYNMNFNGKYTEDTINVGSIYKPNHYIIFGNSSACDPNSTTLANYSVSSGQSFSCNSHSVFLKPNINFLNGSSVNLKGI